MRLALALALFVVGCQSTLRAGRDNSPDARGHSTADSSGSDVDAYVAPPDADPNACTNGRQVYLNFGGATLTRGASDATNNVAAWVGLNSGQQTATIPAYKNGDANAATTVATAVRNGLAPYPKIK